MLQVVTAACVVCCQWCLAAIYGPYSILGVCSLCFSYGHKGPPKFLWWAFEARQSGTTFEVQQFYNKPNMTQHLERPDNTQQVQ
jgi:hypothetical protein